MLIHFFLIRYVIRLFIYPLANPIIKSIFTAFYLDDYLKMLQIRLKNYYNLLILWNENNFSQKDKIKNYNDNLDRYILILREINELIKILRQPHIQSKICEKINKIIESINQVINNFNLYINYLDNRCISSEDNMKEQEENLRTSIEDYHFNVENFYEAININKSLRDYIRLFFKTDNILELFQNILKIENKNSREYSIDNIEMYIILFIFYILKY